MEQHQHARQGEPFVEPVVASYIPEDIARIILDKYNHQRRVREEDAFLEKVKDNILDLFITDDANICKFRGYDVTLTDEEEPWTVAMVFKSKEHDIYVFYDGIKLITKEKRCGCCAPVVVVKDVLRPYGRFESNLVELILNVKKNGPEIFDKWVFGDV